MTIDNILIVPKTIHLKKLDDEKPFIMFKGDDGKSYRTPEGLREANRAYFARMHPIKVRDALGGREFAPGSGEVQVCVGFKKERDEYGMRREVHVYQTRRF